MQPRLRSSLPYSVYGVHHHLQARLILDIEYVSAISALSYGRTSQNATTGSTCQGMASQQPGVALNWTQNAFYNILPRSRAQAAALTAYRGKNTCQQHNAQCTQVVPANTALHCSTAACCTNWCVLMF